MTSPATGPVRRDGVARCPWVTDDPVYRAYHDTEWGTPCTDERMIYEKICLEGFQAGLSWLTVLRKREAFRSAFQGFEPARVARFGARDVTRLMKDASIVRNRAKIESAITNARAVLALHESGGSLVDVVWSHEPRGRRRAPRRTTDLVASTPESEALSADLRRLGFTFVGPTTMWAMMQSLGVVNDHLVGCDFR